MKKQYALLSLLFSVALLLVVLAACKKDPDPVAKSSAKAITGFSFVTPAVTATVDNSAKTITGTLPIGTNASSLVPTIVVSGKAMVSPASGTAQDFTKAVVYTVTAEDGTTQRYTVTMTVSKATGKDILTFTFNTLTPAVSCSISSDTKVISTTLPVGTSITVLSPTVTVSDRATVLPASGVAQDFTKAVSYTVTAEDGSTQIYSTSITVAVLPSVTTGASSALTPAGFSVAGTIVATGSAGITQYGHVWSATNQLPTVADSRTSLGVAAAPRAYTSDITVLTANTLYYVRAYATSAAGTVYGSAIQTRTSAISNDNLMEYNSIKLVLQRGANYSSPDQPCLLNVTTGNVYSFSTGTTNATNVDLVIYPFSSQTGYDDVKMAAPSTLLESDPFWGDFGKKIVTQNWSIYKATKMGYLDKAVYPAITGWSKINTATDLAGLLKNVSQSPNEFRLMRQSGLIDDATIWTFQTREGKQGMLRITDGQKKSDTYTIMIDIKVQK